MLERSRRISLPALVLACAVALLAIGPSAAGAVTNVKSTVVITSGEGTRFTGRVSSGKKKCRAGRTVKLYYQAGSTARMGDPLAGTAKTRANGTWVIDGSFLAAIYYVQLTAMTVHVNGVAYRCGAASSIAMHY